MAQHVPLTKLVVGLPFYGRHITDRQQARSYREIVARYQPSRDVDEIDGIFFNGAETIARKTRFALQKDLAGVMIWELGQDAAGDASLLHVIDEQLRHIGE